MVQRYRDGQVLVLSDDVRRNFAFLNAAFIGVLASYWLLLFVLPFSIDWIGTWPLTAKILVPLVMSVATFGAARIAAAYTKRVRGREDIDTRISVWHWLLFPVILPAFLLVLIVTEPFNWTGLKGDLFTWSIDAIIGLAWSRYYVGPDIGDFTFE